MLLCLCLMLTAMFVLAEKKPKQKQPSMALLEFLADMHLVDGRLISPLEMQEVGKGSVNSQDRVEENTSPSDVDKDPIKPPVKKKQNEEQP